MKINIFYIAAGLIFVILLALLLHGARVLRSQSDEISRLHSNIEAMRADLRTFVTKDGKNAAEAKEKTLTKEEVRDIFKAELATLDANVRDIKKITILATEKQATVRFDTIIQRDTLPPLYTYEDKWIKLRVEGDSANIQCFDSLMVVSHAKTKKFLWWTWKRYSGKTTVKSYSPYTTITAIEATDVK